MILPLDSGRAYFLGYFAADGCMCAASCSKRVEVSSNDEQAIDVLHGILGRSNRSKWKKSYRMIVSGKELYSELLGLGMSPRKSLTLQWPEKLTEKLFPHFIRGYFDGDGCVGLYKSTTGADCAVATVACGSKSFLDKMESVIRYSAGTSRRNVRKIGRTNCWELRYNTSDAVRLGLYMYQGNPEDCMHRKRDKFYEIMNRKWSGRRDPLREQKGVT